MKKSIYFSLFIIIIGIFSPIRIYASTDQQVRDSIFRVASSIPSDSLRSSFLRDVFQKYIGQELATEYLDSALNIAKRANIQGEEIWVLFDYCRQYEFRSEILNFEKRLAILKEASYKYKIYDYYYTMWLSLLQTRCSLGDTEYAIMQAKEMSVEANRLKYEGGLFIAALTLAQAYDAAGQYDEAVATYRQALKDNPKANKDALLMIYGNLAGIFKKQNKYPQALDELQNQFDVLTKISKKFNLPSGSIKTLFLNIEIAFCKIYMETENEKLLNLHLKRAKMYYENSIHLGSYIDYHTLWANYYKLTKEWNKSIKEFDLALSVCRGVNPFYENSVLKSKASVLMELGYYKDALDAYQTAALRGDSLNQDMLKRHEEAHAANYKIRKALLEKEELTKRYRYIQVGAGLAILLFMVLAIINAIRMRRQLLLAEEETRKTFETAEAADKMKERFLHNITYEIRIPLNTVVGFSELLSSENGLTDEEIEEYSATVKKNSTKLLALINNILDLSRLEAGMMRFIVQECDVVQLCQEAKLIVEMQKPGTVEMTFNTKLESLQIEADSKWFLRLLTTLLTVPNDYVGEPRKVEYNLSTEGKQLIICVKGSPLYQCWGDEQELHILTGINRLYVETFKGRYRALEEGKEQVVYITYPIS